MLAARHDKNISVLYQDLKPVKRDRLDFLKEKAEFQVIAVDSIGTQVNVDPAVSEHAGATWSWEGNPLQVTVINEYTLQLGCPLPELESGHLFIRHSVVADTCFLHERLLEYWRTTWCAHSSVSPEVWANVTGFFTAFMPTLDFTLSPITLQQWRHALCRYKPTAARGVDGISHLDLLALPGIWTLRLLELLNQIEGGTLQWPQCVLYGVVNLLAKDIDPVNISRYRPVVTFSIIYRTWSSLRAKQLLTRLS